MQFSISNNAWFLFTPIFTISKESNKILFISFKVLPGITATKSFTASFKALVFHANLNPSTATTFNLLFLISNKHPVKIGLFSSVLTAKIVFLIISFKDFCSNSIEFSTSIFGSSGNSSGFIVANLYNEPSHSIISKLFLSKDILISVSGNFLIISLNIILFTTVAPCSIICASLIIYSIPISKSYVVNFISLSLVWIKIPSNIGIVVLLATAFVTELIALRIFSFSQTIFIFIVSLL